LLNNEKEIDMNNLYCNYQNKHPMASRVGAEVVNGRERLRHIDKAISIFGGSKATKNSWAYIQSYELANSLAKRGVSVISGGGPGIMEAANKGTKDAKNELAKAIGLNINISAEKNNRQHQDISIEFQHFASRKIIFCAHSDAFVVAPGGFGTLDELFEVLTLMQTNKSEIVPIILMGEEFWVGLMVWVREQMISSGLLSESHYNYVTIAKDWEDVILKLENCKII
jgi:uncharacterized protein (TIGR00730 family)